MLKCLTAPRIAKTSQELPPQNKWAASFQPEDAGTKLNFLYDDLEEVRLSLKMSLKLILSCLKSIDIQRHMEF